MSRVYTVLKLSLSFIFIIYILESATSLEKSLKKVLTQ